MCIVYTLFLNEDYNCICIPLSYVKFQTWPLYEIVNERTLNPLFL